MTDLPRAILIDLDDTILSAFGRAAGQWERVDSKWRWARGGWGVPPKGARFTGFRVRRERDGLLRFAAARWTDAAGQSVEVERLQDAEP